MSTFIISYNSIIEVKSLSQWDSNQLSEFLNSKLNDLTVCISNLEADPRSKNIEIPETLSSEVNEIERTFNPDAFKRFFQLILDILKQSPIISFDAKSNTFEWNNSDYTEETFKLFCDDFSLKFNYIIETAKIFQDEFTPPKIEKRYGSRSELLYYMNKKQKDIYNKKIQSRFAIKYTVLSTLQNLNGRTTNSNKFIDDLNKAEYEYLLATIKRNRQVKSQQDLIIGLDEIFKLKINVDKLVRSCQKHSINLDLFINK